MKKFITIGLSALFACSIFASVAELRVECYDTTPSVPETTIAPPEAETTPSFAIDLPITLPTPETTPITTIEDTTVEETTEVPIAPKYECVPLSDALKQFIVNECAKYDLSPSLVFGIIYKETLYGTYKSKYDPKTERYTVKGDNGKSYGLMQIQLRYAEKEMKLLDCDDLCDNFQNVRVGIYILAQHIEWAEARWPNYAVECGILAYNRGRGGATTYIRSKGAKRVAKNSYVKVVLDEANRVGSEENE